MPGNSSPGKRKMKFDTPPSSPTKQLKMATKQEKMEAFGQLLDILDELRVKCPWDRKQTNESLRTNTIEETYELCDAIMKDDNNNIKKELGDLLLHIVFYAKIGEEKAAFDIKDDRRGRRHILR